MSNIQLVRRPKVIFCDIDKTLTSEDIWYLLTTSLNGDLEIHFQLYTKYVRKQISFEEMKKGLFDMWKKGYGGPIPRKVLEDIFFKVELRGEAFAFFSDLNSKGYEVCLISSYMDVFVKQVAERLQIKHWYANSLFQFDENDNWIDYKQDTDEAGFKLRKLEDFLQRHKIAKDECLVLGGGYEEMEVFRHYPGVAVNTEYEPLITLAWKEIKYLPTLLQILNQFE